MSTSWFIAVVIHVFLFHHSQTFCLGPTLYNAFECANEDSRGQITASVYVDGYKSHSGPLSQISTPTGSKVFCRGAFSCADTLSIVSDGIACPGALSCANITNITAFADEGSIFAYAVGAMAYSTAHVSGTNDTNQFMCSGERSCAHSYISHVEYLYASGAYSLLNTTIDATSNNQNLTFHFYAQGYYAAFGATIICDQPAIRCHIWCSVTSCINLKLLCATSNCDIYGNGKDDPNNFRSIVIQDVWRYDALHVAQQNDDACAMQVTNMTFDDASQRLNNPIPLENTFDGPICCRARKACEHNAINGTLGANQSLVCSAYDSCLGSNITINGPVFCSGRKGCDSSHITATTVYCSSQLACRNAVIIGASNVYCSGHQSCRDAVIVSDGSDLEIHLLAHTTGQDMNITCGPSDRCSIFCDSQLGCQRTNVECVGVCTIHCNNTDANCPILVNSTQNPTQNPTQVPSTATPTTPDPTTASPTTPSPTTHDPTTQDPTTQGPTTYDPTTQAPTTQRPTTQMPTPFIDVSSTAVMESMYTVSIEIIGCNNELTGDECVASMNETTIMRQINHILVAYLDYDVHVLSTDILDNTIIVRLSVTTDEDNQLDGDVIGRDIEREFEREYTEYDIDVSVEETMDIQDDDQGNQDTLFYILVLCFIVVVLCVVCAVCVLYKSKKQANKQVWMMDTEMQRDTPGNNVTTAGGDDDVFDIGVTTPQPGTMEYDEDAQTKQATPEQEENGTADDLDGMCVHVDGEESVSKSEQTDGLDQGTTEGGEDQRVSVHQTKGGSTRGNDVDEEHADNIAPDEFIVCGDDEENERPSPQTITKF
eukprot:316801_1